MAAMGSGGIGSFMDAPVGGGILGRFENVRSKKSQKQIIVCGAATPHYQNDDFLKPQHYPIDKVDEYNNYSATSNLQETRFHRGFQRRNQADIQQDVARMETELARERLRDDRDRATVQATLDWREKNTFNILSGEGVGRESEFRQVGKKIVNPFQCMEAVYSEHARDATNRLRQSKDHRVFEHPLPDTEARAKAIFGEGLKETKRETCVLGYGNTGKRRIRVESQGVADNFAHLRAESTRQEYEKPFHGNRSQILLG
jgi:hypothetical protein